MAGNLEKRDIQVKEGNFALGSSQQPFPLFSFGQLIVDKGDFLGYFFMDFFKGTQRKNSDASLSLLYGIRDDFSVLVSLPISAGQKYGNATSSGMEDIFVECEYEFFAHSQPTTYQAATVVGSISFPSGSATKNPATGFGSPTFLIGFTLGHISVKWYAFISPGVILTTKNSYIKYGNQFLYQGGWGRNIESPQGWIFMFMCEFLGQYSQRNTVQGMVDNNSGGNTFLILPSLWFSSKRFIGQVGAGWFAGQHLYGQQYKNKHVVAFTAGWKF